MTQATDRDRAGLHDPWADVVERCRTADEASWAEVYRTFAPLVVRFLRRLLGGGFDTDDLVQQVFVAMVQSIGEYRGDARFSTWVYGIAANVALKTVRRETRWRRWRRGYAEWLEVVGSHVPDASGGADARALMRVLGEVLERLTFDHRTVWVMRELEGLDSDETARALDVPVGTVRSRLFHARREVGAALVAAGFGESVRMPEPAPVHRMRTGNEV